MEPYLFWAAAVSAAVLVGLGKGGLPILGQISVPIFALVVSPVVAAGVLLPVYVASDMFGLYAYRHHFDRRVLAIMIPAATLGVFMGWATAHLVPDAMVTLFVGLIGLCFGLLHIYNRKFKKTVQGAPQDPSVPGGIVWGSLTGFTSFVSHAGGPPWQVYTLPIGMSKQVFAGTSTIFFAAVNAVKLIPYYALGQLSPENLSISAFLLLPAVISVFIGVWLVKRMPEKLFFNFVLGALILVSIKLIQDGAQELWALI